MITYYITKYYLTTPLFKTLFILFITIILKTSFDCSSVVECMNGTPVDNIGPPTKHVTFEISDEQRHIMSLREEIEKQRRIIADLEMDATNYRRTIRALSDSLLEQRTCYNHILLDLDKFGFEISYR